LDAVTDEIVRAEDKGLRSRVVPLAFWGLGERTSLALGAATETLWPITLLLGALSVRVGFRRAAGR
jgi:hypothetical protein